MSQTGRDYSEKRDYIRMRVFADKKSGHQGPPFFQFTGRDQKSSST